MQSEIDSLKLQIPNIEKSKEIEKTRLADIEKDFLKFEAELKNFKSENDQITKDVKDKITEQNENEIKIKESKSDM